MKKNPAKRLSALYLANHQPLKKKRKRKGDESKLLKNMMMSFSLQTAHIQK